MLLDPTADGVELGLLATAVGAPGADLFGELVRRTSSTLDSLWAVPTAGGDGASRSTNELMRTPVVAWVVVSVAVSVAARADPGCPGDAGLDVGLCGGCAAAAGGPDASVEPGHGVATAGAGRYRARSAVDDVNRAGMTPGKVTVPRPASSFETLGGIACATERRTTDASDAIEFDGVPESRSRSPVVGVGFGRVTNASPANGWPTTRG